MAGKKPHSFRWWRRFKGVVEDRLHVLMDMASRQRISKLGDGQRSIVSHDSIATLPHIYSFDDSPSHSRSVVLFRVAGALPGAGEHGSGGDTGRVLGTGRRAQGRPRCPSPGRAAVHSRWGVAPGPHGRCWGRARSTGQAEKVMQVGERHPGLDVVRVTSAGRSDAGACRCRHR